MSVPGGGYPNTQWGPPPQSLLDYNASVEEGANRRFDATLGAQVKAAKATLDNQYRIAKLQASTEAEKIAVDRWYKEQQVALAQKTFDESVRQFDKTYGLKEADATGWFGGKPTLAREAQDAKLTGMYGGQQTLEAKELERRFGLAEGTLTGMYGGQQTLEAQELARRFGLDQSKFGLDVAKTAADMRSRPDMLFQYGEFARNLPGFLGGPQAGGRQAMSAGPQGQTIAGTLGEVGMGGMQGPWNQQQTATAIAGGAPAYTANAAGGMGQGGAPLTPQEQERWQQLMARHDEIRAAGGQGLTDADLAEAKDYAARGATYAGPATPAPRGGGAGAPPPGGAVDMRAYISGGDDPYARYASGVGSGGGAQGNTHGSFVGGGLADNAAGGSWFQPYSAWTQQQGGGGGGSDGMRYASGAGATDPSMAYLSAAQTGAGADPTLAAIGKTYKAGFDKLGAQSLEKMDSNDLGFLHSGGSYMGYDFDREMRKYAGSRLGQ